VADYSSVTGPDSDIFYGYCDTFHYQSKSCIAQRDEWLSPPEKHLGAKHEALIEQGFPARVSDAGIHGFAFRCRRLDKMERAGRGGKMARRILLVSVPVLLVLLAGAALLMNGFLRQYLASEAFRQLISERTSSALHIRGEFAPIRWVGTSAYSENFLAGPGPGSPVARLEATRLRSDFNWRAIFSGAWRLEEVNIGTLRVELADPEVPMAGSFSMDPSPPAARRLPGWFPKKFELGQAELESVTLVSAPATLRGMRTLLTQDGTGWEIDGQGGSLQMEHLPANEIIRLRARASSHGVFITGAHLQFRSGGNLKGTGEYLFEPSSYVLRLEWRGLDFRSLRPEGSHPELTGEFSGQATVEGSGPDERVSTGSFRLSEGRLENLPILRTLGRFTKSPQFERLAVHEMSGDFTHRQEGTDIREFVLESKGLIRVEGNFTIGADSELSGHLEVGLTPQTLRWLPGSQEKVFTLSRGGYLWTPVTVGGTVERPTENLSTRLAMALGEEVIGTGGRILEQSIEQSTDTAVEGVREVLDVLLPLFP